MHTRSSLIFAGLLALCACFPGDPPDRVFPDTGVVPPEPGTPGTAIAISAVDIAPCSPEFGPDVINLYVRTDGWPARVVWHLTDASNLGEEEGEPYTEQHDLDITASSAGGELPAWEEWQVNLTPGDPAEVVPGVSTGFSCEAHGDGCSIAARVRVFAENQNIADCAIYGHRASEAYPEAERCTNFGPEITDTGSVVTCDTAP